MTLSTPATPKSLSSARGPRGAVVGGLAALASVGWYAGVGAGLYVLQVVAGTLAQQGGALPWSQWPLFAALCALQLLPVALVPALLLTPVAAGLARVFRQPAAAGAAAAAPSPGRLRRLALGPAPGLVVFLATLAAHAADMLLYVRLYAWAHALLAAAALTGCVVVTRLLLREPLGRWTTAPRRRWLGLLVPLLVPLSLGLTGLLLSGRPALRRIAFHHAFGLSHALGLQTTLWDRDGDGFSPLYGAGDCDDHDPAVYPLASEVPGDGVDNDCSGGQALTGAQAAASPEPAAAPGNALAVSVEPPAGLPNILLLTYDALRFDRLRAGGADRALVPNFERLAEQGTFFGNAYAPGCSTMPSVVGLLTGRYPRRVRRTWIGFDHEDYIVRLRRSREGHLWQPSTGGAFFPAPVGDPSPTLAERLRGLGYRTLTASSVLFFRRGTGLVRGFEVVDDQPFRQAKAAPAHLPRIDAGRVAQAGIRLLEQHAGRRRPFLLWLHFLDPHHPYERLPAEPDLGPEDSDRYDVELWRVDRAVGAVLGWLAQRGLLERTVVIAAGDHGEEFGDHGAQYHASSLYDELVHVPLAMRVPGRAPSTQWADVSLVDVVPTVLDLLGQPQPAGLDGRSLLPLLEGRAMAERPIILECVMFQHALLGVVSGAHKLIHDLRFNTYELYDRAQDPAETLDLTSLQPQIRRDLAGRLQRWRDTPIGAAGPAPTPP